MPADTFAGDVTVLPRPQPIGALPWPAGLLVLPDVPDSEYVRADLCRGVLPAAWPAGLDFVRLALAEEPAAAAALLTDDDPVSAYNRAVLVGGEGAWDGLLSTDGDLGALVAVATYSVGLRDDLPEPAGVEGEIAAVLRSARASAALERGDTVTALTELAAGADDAEAGGSMILAASLRATAAEILRPTDPVAAVAEVDRALRGMPRQVDDAVRIRPPAELWADLHVTRALARQELAVDNPGLLLAVTQDLTEALKTFTEEDHPEQFAACNAHLALAYLVMPMSTEGDRLRVGVAVTSLRAALRVYSPDTHPTMWASTQMNLANALQYLPSVHQETNLDEAVQLYEELLQARDPRTDPVGVARILANQGNALGHLGVFSDARERLGRARDLFASAGDDDGVTTVNDLLGRVAEAAADSGRAG